MKMSIIIISILLSACSSKQTLTGTSQPRTSDYQVGEKWVWKYKGVTSQGIIRADGEDIKEVIKDDGVMKISDGKNHIEITKITEPNQSATPRFKWPLSVGKTWTFEETWKSQDGTTGKSTQEVEVISYQKEKVMAGSFMTYKIQYKGKITNSRGYNAVTDEVILYAPSIKNFIKLTQKQDDYYYVEELKEYFKPN